MSRIQFSAPIEEIIGKLAGSVFQDSYMGIQIRTRVSPRNPQTFYQQLRRGQFGFISSGWRNLTTSQRNTWIAEAGTILEAFRLYVGCNINLVLAELSPVTSFTASTIPVSFPIEISEWVNSSLKIRATGSPSSVPANHALLIFATSEKLPSKIFTSPSEFSPIVTLPAGTSLTSSVQIGSDWMARYGQFTNGNRLCVQSALVNVTNGLRGAGSISCAIEPLVSFNPLVGSAWAVSVRRIGLTYSGNCMQVRRTSDNSLLNIGFDSGGLLDVAALESFCSGTDGTVHTWYDQSGNGIDWVQTTNSLQPYICRSGSVVQIGGLPAVRQIGYQPAGSVGRLGYTFASTGANPSSFFEVAHQQTTSPEGVVQNTGTVLSDNNSEFVMLPVSGSAAANYSGSGTPSFWVDGTSKTITTRGQAATEYLPSPSTQHINRILSILSLDLSTYTSFETQRFGSGSLYGDHFIAERIMYYSDQSANRILIQDNMNAFFRIFFL